MKIRVERSGGLAGISMTNEMDAKDLPSSLVLTAKKIVKDPNLTPLPVKSITRGAADHFTYKISIQEGANHRIIECNQYNIENDLKSLVKYIERNSKQKMN